MAFVVDLRPQVGQLLLGPGVVVGTEGEHSNGQGDLNPGPVSALVTAVVGVQPGGDLLVLGRGGVEWCVGSEGGRVAHANHGVRQTGVFATATGSGV